MSTPKLLARHFSEFINGNSMTGASVREHLDDVTFSEATTQLGDLNTIALLVFHINYYAEAQMRVLQGQDLDAKDSLSFAMNPLKSPSEWDQLRLTFYNNMSRFTQLIEALTTKDLEQIFVLEKYGTYHRNLLGMIEHAHYHFGQIVLLKKLSRL